MELSQEIQTLFNKYKIQPNQTDKYDKSPYNNKNNDAIYNPDELIDVDQIDMNDDQTWLMKTETVIPNINGWLHESTSYDNTLNDVDKFQKKCIDSRTFTRPKKKLYRPSIEKYKEELFEDEKVTNKNVLSQEIDNYISKCQKDEINDSFQLQHREKPSEDKLLQEKLFQAKPLQDKPIQFDFSQPVSGSFFERILATAPELDSFQNMSPPSLVNSMCSSTFTNLMENSYIKNDPMLREIRDADYSNEIYSDTLEPPLLQSFTESCSSITTEIAENFVRRTLNNLNGTYQVSASPNEPYKIPNGTELALDLDDFSGDENDKTILQNETHIEKIDQNVTMNINDTYQKDYKFNRAYDKDDLSNSFPCITDSQENKTLNTSNNLNSTLTIKHSKIDKQQIENCEKITDDFSSKYQQIMEPIKNNLNTTQIINKTFERRSLERSPLNDSHKKAGGKKSLPSKLNNTFTLDYCDMEEEIMNSVDKRLSDEIDEYLSKTQEIIKENNLIGVAYSDESSESLDRLSSLSNSSRGSRNMLMSDVDALVEQQEKSLQISTPKPSKSLTKLFDNSCLSPIPKIEVKEHMSDSEISEEYCSSSKTSKRSTLERNVKSLSNLKAPLGLKQHSINTMTNKLVNKRVTSSSGLLGSTQTKYSGSYSNLRMLNSNLKGSYTTLRPFQSNLPNIPPKNSGMAKTDVNIAKYMEKTEEFRIPKTTKSAGSSKDNLVKPLSKSSGLPRPVSSATGIPRPSFSKIPAPKSTRLPSSRQIARPGSKININDGFY